MVFVHQMAQLAVISLAGWPSCVILFVVGPWLVSCVVCFTRQVAQLVEDNRRLQATISKLRDTTSSQAARLEEELSSKTRSVEILQEKLAAQSDYDEVKRELRSVRPQSLLSLLLYSFYLPSMLLRCWFGIRKSN